MNNILKIILLFLLNLFFYLIIYLPIYGYFVIYHFPSEIKEDYYIGILIILAVPLYFCFRYLLEKSNIDKRFWKESVFAGTFLSLIIMFCCSEILYSLCLEIRTINEVENVRTIKAKAYKIKNYSTDMDSFKVFKTIRKFQKPAAYHYQFYYLIPFKTTDKGFYFAYFYEETSDTRIDEKTKKENFRIADENSLKRIRNFDFIDIKYFRNLNNSREKEEFSKALTYPHKNNIYLEPNFKTLNKELDNQWLTLGFAFLLSIGILFALSYEKTLYED